MQRVVRAQSCLGQQSCVWRCACTPKKIPKSVVPALLPQHSSYQHVKPGACETGLLVSSDGIFSKRHNGLLIYNTQAFCNRLQTFQHWCSISLRNMAIAILRSIFYKLSLTPLSLSLPRTLYPCCNQRRTLKDATTRCKTSSFALLY